MVRDQNNGIEAPGVATVARIAALQDPVIRNLQITHCYHELALALAARTGPVANWCTFATWASRQAGQTIRQEDLRQTLERVLRAVAAGPEAAPTLEGAAAEAGTSPEALGEAFREAWSPAAAAARAAAAVARGNLKVFAEIGDAFARFLEQCAGHTEPDEDNLARFCATLAPGEPPHGQQLLRQAFTHYYQALFAADNRQRAELMLLANLEVGLHEQTRLQPEIAAGLEAAVVDPRRISARLARVLFPYGGWPMRLRLVISHLIGRPTLFERAVAAMTESVRLQARQLLTRYLMVLRLPSGEELRLGQDLRARFPEALQQLADPELRALLARIDPTPDSVRDSGAVDWANLADRLHFIADLFRAYQEDVTLLAPPFSAAQLSALRAGRLPAGPL